MSEGDVPTPTPPPPPPEPAQRTWPIELVKILALPLVTLVLGYWFNASLNERVRSVNSPSEVRIAKNNGMNRP